MSEIPKLSIPFRTYDHAAEKSVVRRKLPHWCQATTLCFITWRTWDSIPKNALDRWLFKRNAWLRSNGLACHGKQLQVDVSQLNPKLQTEYQLKMTLGWNRLLDQAHGACVLRDSKLAAIVADALKHGDERFYILYDYVIMPNHVHLIAAFPDNTSQLKVCRNWKHLTAARINQALDRQGRFWQPEPFDHLIRTEAQFYRLRRYIAENPEHAGLQLSQTSHYSRSI